MQDAYYKRKVCYCCEKEYAEPHAFYKEMCPACGEYNWQKRNQKIALQGYRALVTGGRIKIGFEIARLLLEMGADVTVTSRFPQDTYKRYAALDGFESFKKRFHIIGVDFRHLPSVSKFIKEIKKQPLDILINNAAQTVRKPAPFYKHLMNEEKNAPLIENIITNNAEKESSLVPVSKLSFLPALNFNLNSAEMSQVALLPEDLHDDESIFPAGQYDKDGQQLDLRSHNSWMYELEEISLIELYEVLHINLITPFLLNTKLLPSLTQNGRNAFIINVSAMEGNFFAPRKHSRHAHTNMAKAALNMMTRTAAAHYKDYGVLMNSVDTGWITNEKPNPQNLNAAERKTVMAIDEVDGAMRVLDPVIRAIRDDEKDYGKLFKNYREYPW